MSHGIDISPKKIVDEYFDVLKKRMAAPSRLLRMADEEDVAIEAIEKFLRLARQGTFGYIASREHLSGLIFMIARRRLKEMVVYETALKRGGNSKMVFIDQQLGSQLSDVSHRAKRSTNAKVVLERLTCELDGGSREILELWMQGKDSAMISREIGVSRRTVQYRLAKIRGRLTRCAQDAAS